MIAPLAVSPSPSGPPGAERFRRRGAERDAAGSPSVSIDDESLYNENQSGRWRASNKPRSGRRSDRAPTGRDCAHDQTRTAPDARANGDASRLRPSGPSRPLRSGTEDRSRLRDARPPAAATGRFAWRRAGEENRGGEGAAHEVQVRRGSRPPPVVERRGSRPPPATEKPPPASPSKHPKRGSMRPPGKGQSKPPSARRRRRPRMAERRGPVDAPRALTERAARTKRRLIRGGRTRSSLPRTTERLPTSRESHAAIQEPRATSRDWISGSLSSATPHPPAPCSRFASSPTGEARRRSSGSGHQDSSLHRGAEDQPLDFACATRQGVMHPICETQYSVNQMRPSGPAVMYAGTEPAVELRTR